MDLINQARAGDEEAFVELFLNYRPVVYAMMGKYFIRDFDEEDWLQEGRIALFKSLQNYDDQRGVSLGLYFKNIFENQIRSELRRQNAYKRRSLVDCISLEQKMLSDGPDFLGEYNYRSARADQQLILFEMLTEFPQLLSDLELDVLTHFLQGITPKEMAENEAMPLLRVRSAFERARKKMATALLVETT